MAQSVEQRTATWVADLDNAMAARLAALDLIAPREPKAPVGLGAFFDDYVSKRVDVKEATKEVVGPSRTQFEGSFWP